jgi:4-amino-4-deoxy-L-arabinose transferase-like glycosyltransferase
LGASRLYPHPPLYYLLSLPFYFPGTLGGILTQLYALRIFSVLLMCAAVWLTYELTPLVYHLEYRPWLAIFPAALIALQPQYVFISASYNNDALTVPLVAAALLFFLRGYRRNANIRDLLVGLVFTLLAISAKRTAIGLLPVLAVAILTYSLIEVFKPLASPGGGWCLGVHADHPHHRGDLSAQPTDDPCQSRPAAADGPEHARTIFNRLIF